MNDSKKYHVANIVTNEEMQCEGYMDFVVRNMKEQLSNGILDIVADGKEYAIKMLPEIRMEHQGTYSTEVRYGISVQEIVRCGECKYNLGETTSGKSILCNYCTAGMLHERAKDWFCADGERKVQE